jgi:hypothetical protein
MINSSQFRLPDGVALILVATAVAGGCGYIANILVGATRSAADYVEFGVFWSALYLLIAALSGVQQEVTRATHRRTDGDTSPNPARNFGIAAAVVVGLLIAASGPLWSGALFPKDGLTFVLPIAFGAAAYVVVAVIAGTLYGLSLWRGIALMMTLDGVLRLAAIIVALAIGGGINALAWAVVLPFILTPLIVWWFLRRSVVGRTKLDVGYGPLIRNVFGTVLASIATGLLISGFPLVLRVTSPGAGESEMGALIFAINLVRAPLVIVVLSLQSYLVVRFRNTPEHAIGTFVRLATLIVGCGLVLAVAAWYFLSPVLGIFGSEYALEPWVIAGLVLTSSILGVLCVSGPLALSRSQHVVYTTGWVVAALVSTAVLLIPGDSATRMLVSLAIGPVVGASVHVFGVIARRPVPG